MLCFAVSKAFFRSVEHRAKSGEQEALGSMLHALRCIGCLLRIIWTDTEAQKWLQSSSILGWQDSEIVKPVLLARQAVSVGIEAEHL